MPVGASVAPLDVHLLTLELDRHRLAVFLALAAAQGYARVRVRAHHPGDVAAGAVVGVAAAELSRRALRVVLPDPHLGPGRA